jgi:hypothetical protein
MTLSGQSKHHRNGDKINTNNTHDRSLSWLGTGASIKVAGLNQFSFIYFYLHESNTIITKNAIILNIIHNIFTRAFNIFPVYRYFTIYRRYLLL